MPDTFLAAGEYTAPIIVENIGATRIRGEGIGRTILRVDGPYAIQMIGKVGSLEVSDLSIALNGKGVGIGCNSGTEINRFRVRRVEVSNGVTGISMNADLAGYFRNAKVQDCHIHDMPGEVSGSGYGIHAANAENVTISANLLERCGRHSIYQGRTAKRTPGAIKIIGNTIREHRKGTTTPNYPRCAISVTRSSGVLVAYNQVIDGYGGGLEIAADGESTERPWPCDSIDVRDNQFFGRKDSLCYVMLGEQQVPPGYVLEDVSLTGNRFDTVHDGEARQPDIWILNGRNITLSNIHRHRGSDGTIQRAVTIGDRRFGTSSSHINNIIERGSDFWYDDKSANARSITVDVPTGTKWKASILAFKEP